MSEDEDRDREILNYLDEMEVPVPMTPADQKACDERHEAEEALRVERLDNVAMKAASAVKDVESRIKLWVLMIGFTMLAFVAGAFVTGLVQFGSYQEKIEQVESRQQRDEVQFQKQMELLQEKLDRILWAQAHGGGGS